MRSQSFCRRAVCASMSDRRLGIRPVAGLLVSPTSRSAGGRCLWDRSYMVDDSGRGPWRRRGRNSGDDRAQARSDEQSSHRRCIRFDRSVDRFRCRRPRPPVHVTDGFVAARGLRCPATIGARGAGLRHRCRDRRRPRRRGQHSVQHWLRTRSVSPDSRAYRCDGILGRRRRARRRDPGEPDRVGLARGTTLARRPTAMSQPPSDVSVS